MQAQSLRNSHTQVDLCSSWGRATLLLYPQVCSEEKKGSFSSRESWAPPGMCVYVCACMSACMHVWCVCVSCL